MIWLVLLLGLTLRLINLNQSLWLDEAITAQAVKNYSFGELIPRFSPGDFHPPLYYLFLKMWTNFFGYGEIVLRLPSVIFGVGAIFFVYLIGKKLFSKRTGIIAAIFLAVNPLAVYYSQEARMYSLAMMLVAGAIWFLLEKKWGWFMIFSLASVFTDYLPWLMFPVYFLMTKNRRVLIVPILLYLAWIPYFLSQLKTGLAVSAAIPLWSQVLGGFSLKALALTFIKFIFGRISWDNKILYAVFTVAVGAGYLWMSVRSRVKTLWFWLLIPLLLGLLLSLKVSVFTYFRFLFVLPAFTLLLAGGAKNRIAVIFVVLISLLSLAWFNLNPRFWREDWRSAVAYMEAGGGIVEMPSLAQADPIYYYRRSLQLTDSNGANFKGYTNVYLIRYVQEIFDPKDTLKTKLEVDGYERVQESQFNGVVIWKYSL